jgi:hypothetical protein
MLGGPDHPYRLRGARVPDRWQWKRANSPNGHHALTLEGSSGGHTLRCDPGAFDAIGGGCDAALDLGGERGLSGLQFGLRGDEAGQLSLKVAGDRGELRLAHDQAAFG